MSSPDHQQPDNQLTFLQLAVLSLSVVVLGALLIDSMVALPGEVSKTLQIFDTAVCGVLIFDFALRLHRTKDKLSFLKWGWIDLVASIPNIDFLRWGRTIRILRIIRILRGIRSFQKVIKVVFRHRLQSGLGTALMTSGLLIMFSSTAILMAETGPDANIKTAEEAIWWSVTTITTVGYGDKFPTTTEGRVIAMVLMISGVGLFGTLSGLVASYFLGHNESESVELEQLSAQLRSLEKKIDQLQPPEKWRE